MVITSTSDVAILGAGVVIAGVYLFREQIFAAKPKAVEKKSAAVADTDDNSRDFVKKMIAGKKRLVIFYGSQTGTAEEYAIRLAKEAKTKFGLASLVCDPDEYDFENLDAVPEGSAVIFVMATYGEGEPTDNAVALYQALQEDTFEFSAGAHALPDLKYVVFGLGNKTYEHYNLIARNVDKYLSAAGAQRIGERGEGDDDRSMEEDYLEWKDAMWESLATALGVEEGQGSDVADFVVSELNDHAQDKVYLGELSARALTKTRGIHDAKNPYAAPVQASRELFHHDADRNCVHIELGIEGSGISYQAGDHVGVWPSNADVDVDRLLCALGLDAKRDTVIGIESLDPALAKVPFPVPTTYGTVLRHYLDISQLAGRQILSGLAKFAPNERAAEFVRAATATKEAYHAAIADPCLKLGEVLQLAAGDDMHAAPTAANTTAWAIPFDIVVSAVSRLQPRFYSISSSPKMHPGAIHITAVTLKYQSTKNEHLTERWVYGVGSNYLLNIKAAANGEDAPLISEPAVDAPAVVSRPRYAVHGPRGSYRTEEGSYKVPIHVRRSTFRLPTNPRIPVIMIGPGTGVAPFRAFVQERVALARRAVEKNGPDALADWGKISLFYGCRRSTEDFLYREEWPEYLRELQGKFAMHNAFSREQPGQKKVYVQDLLWEDRAAVAEALIAGKGYVYVCGDAKSMAKAVEDTIARILGEAKGGSAEVEGAAELKLLKERSRLMLDVWS